MKTIGFLLTNIKLNFINELQNRGAFLMQVIGMIVNDLALIYVWAVFFAMFGSINGWTQLDMMGAQGIHMFFFGVSHLFFYGAFKLPQTVLYGSFDNLLLTPKKIYFRILTHGMQISALGDLVLGLILIIIFGIVTQVSMIQIIMFVLIIPAGTLIFVNIVLIFSTLAFYMEDSVDTHRGIFELFITPGFYPNNLYEGFLKLFFVFVFPAILVSGVPLDAIKYTSWWLVLVIWLLAIMWTVIAYKWLNHSIKRYESGNLLGVR